MILHCVMCHVSCDIITMDLLTIAYKIYVCVECVVPLAALRLRRLCIAFYAVIGNFAGPLNIILIGQWRSRRNDHSHYYDLHAYETSNPGRETRALVRHVSSKVCG